MLVITRLFPHNELVHMPHIAVATKPGQTTRWRAASYRSSFLLIQLSGRILVGRAGCGADVAGCVLVAGFFPRLLPPSGWGDRPAPEGNADGAVGIFGKCRAGVGYGPAPGPTKKRPCATLSRSVGRGTNTTASYRNSMELLIGIVWSFL